MENIIEILVILSPIVASIAISLMCSKSKKDKTV
ncbi:hypothetical protein J2S18_001601 [Eubacterium multiforme]|uniref:Uncharacterized protein n=1 Tax=Eubacterium multiforme TaxID=83339 RepID=A0ABT9UTP8_9FIRM|nr:hypothetical protein [Eubacterium multiforme]